MLTNRLKWHLLVDKMNPSQTKSNPAKVVLNAKRFSIFRCQSFQAVHRDSEKRTARIFARIRILKMHVFCGQSG